MNPSANRYTRPLEEQTAIAIVCLLLAALLVVFLAQAPLKAVVAGVAGAGFLVLVLSKPAVALPTIALVLPFGRLLAIGGGANVTDLLVGSAVAAWLLQGMAKRRLTVRMSGSIGYWLLAFVWMGALSLTQAASWREGLPEWLKWAEFAIVYWLAVQILDRRWFAVTIAALFLAAVFQGLLGAYQFLGQIGPQGFMLMGRFMRAYGTFEQPNPYAGYLGYLTPVAVSLALAAGQKWLQQGRRPWGLALLAGICALVSLVLIAGIGMSWSRGAWLGLAVALGVILFGQGRRIALAGAGAGIVLIASIVLLGTVWLPGPIADRISDLNDYLVGPDPARTEITDLNFAVLERLAHWQAGQQMFSDHPWLGVGLGNYGAVYPAYALPHWYEPLGHAHNIYINFLAETGALGFLAFLGFWLSAWYASVRAVRDTAADEMIQAIALGVVGTLAYLTLHNVFDNLFVQHMQLQLALLLGGLVAIRSRSNDFAEEKT